MIADFRNRQALLPLLSLTIAALSFFHADLHTQDPVITERQARISLPFTFEQTFGDSGDDHPYAIGLTANGDYILAGGTRSFGAGYYDVYMIKADLNGELRRGTMGYLPR